MERETCIVNEQEEDKVYPTGLYGIDYGILGIGGFPRRLIEIAGGWSGGKTAISLMVGGLNMQRGGWCIFVDAEGCIDEFSNAYLTMLGVDSRSERFIVVSANGGNKAFEMLMGRKECVNSIEKVFDCITQVVLEIKRHYGKNSSIVVIYDSVVGLPSQQELESSYVDKRSRGAVARAFSFCLRKFSGFLSEHKLCCILTNQLREDVSGNVYVEPEYTPGGNAIDYYVSLLLYVKRLRDEGVGKVDGSNRFKVSIRLKKTKIAHIPLGAIEYEYFMVGHGFDKVIDIVNFAVSIGVIEVNGAWYRIGDDKVQGLDNVIKHYRDIDNYKELQVIVEKRIKEVYDDE